MRDPGRVAILISALSLFLGAWLVFDGSRKLLTGLYTGENPAGQGLGPWSKIVSALGINPSDMALPFVLLGLLWLVNGVIMLLGTSGRYERTIVASILTLLPGPGHSCQPCDPPPLLPREETGYLQQVGILQA